MKYRKANGSTAAPRQGRFFYVSSAAGAQVAGFPHSPHPQSGRAA
jgi:hypothetical protein